MVSLLISRTFHATGLGIYSAAIAYYSLIALAGGMGAQDFLVREIAKDRSRTNHYVVHVSVVGTVASVVIMILLLVALPHLGYSVELAAGMYAVTLAIIPGTLNTVQHAVFVAHQRVEFVMYTRFVAIIANIGLCLYLLTHGYGVVSLLAVFVVIEYLVMICFFYFINRYIGALRWEFKPSFALRLVWEMKTFTALSILAGLFAQPEIIILSLVQDEAQVGFYSAAIKLAGFWYFVSQIYMTNVYPVLCRSYYLADQKFQIIQDKSIKYLLALSLPLTAGIIATAEPIVRLFFGPGFEASVLPLQILAWDIPLAFFSAVLWRVLAARDQQDSVLWVRIITLFTRLGGGYFLISWLASLGAAITAPANLLLNTLLLAFYIKRSGIRINFLRLSWRFALAALGMGILTWTFSHQLQLWALVPLAGATYAVLVFLLKAFSPDDFALFRKIWQPGMAERS